MKEIDRGAGHAPETTVLHAREAIRDLAAFLPSIEDLPAEGFDARFYQALGEIETLSAQVPDSRPELLRTCFAAVGPSLETSWAHRHVRRKPFGHAGDFLSIDWIYRGKRDEHPIGGLWDDLSHRSEAAVAVRNRKDHFSNLLAATCRNKGRPVSVLNVACGPCRDVAEAVLVGGSAVEGSSFHCLDVEPRAVAFAQNVTRPLTDKVGFHWQVGNALRFRPRGCYDLVWSGGLFDYLADPVAVSLLRRLWRATAEKGTLTVGNFAPNRSADYLSWCLDWHLLYRTEADLLRLSREAGIPGASVEREPSGTCLFLVARKSEENQEEAG